MSNVATPTKPRKWGIVDTPNGPAINGYLVEEGFWHIQVFPFHFEQNKICYFEVTAGDHPKTRLQKGKMLVLPTALVSNIVDSAQEFPVDDLSDEQRPKRYTEIRARFPHSTPIKATPEDYINYLNELEKLPHPSFVKR